MVVTRDRDGLAVQSGLNTVSAIGGGVVGRGCLEAGAVCAVEGGVGGSCVGAANRLC